MEWQMYILSAKLYQDNMSTMKIEKRDAHPLVNYPEP